MARKKKGLPFVVQPRLQPIIEQIGIEASGILAIERKGYLTVAEKSIVQVGLKHDTTVRKMYILAARIARETSVDQSQVGQDMIKPERPEYLAPYAEDIDECVLEMMAFQERAAIINATALLMCRIDPNWSVEQTMELHPELMAELALLYIEEEKQSTEALEAAAGADSNGAVEGK